MSAGDVPESPLPGLSCPREAGREGLVTHFSFQFCHKKRTGDLLKISLAKTQGAAWQPTPHPEEALRAPSCASPQCSSGDAARAAWEAGLGRRRCGDPALLLRCPGIRVGRVLSHLNRRPVPNFRKDRLALSYDSDTRRPYWLAQLNKPGNRKTDTSCE